MKTFILSLILENRRRKGLALSSLVLAILLTHGVITYLDHSCTHPELGLGVMLLWLTTSFGLVFSCIWLLSPELISTRIFQKWLKFNGYKEHITDQVDPRDLQGPPEKRFWRWCVIGTALILAWSHLGYDRFLTRYQRWGSILIALRSAEPSSQIQGLKELEDPSSP